MFLILGRILSVFGNLINSMNPVFLRMYVCASIHVCEHMRACAWVHICVCVHTHAHSHAQICLIHGVHSRTSQSRGNQRRDTSEPGTTLLPPFPMQKSCFHLCYSWDVYLICQKNLKSTHVLERKSRGRALGREDRPLSPRAA